MLVLVELPRSLIPWSGSECPALIHACCYWTALLMCGLTWGGGGGVKLCNFYFGFNCIRLFQNIDSFQQKHNTNGIAPCIYCIYLSLFSSKKNLTHGVGNSCALPCAITSHIYFLYHPSPCLSYWCSRDANGSSWEWRYRILGNPCSCGGSGAHRGGGGGREQTGECEREREREVRLRWSE